MRIAIATALLLSAPAFADEHDIQGTYRHTTTTTINLTAPQRATQTDSASGSLGVRVHGQTVEFTWDGDGYKCKLKSKVKGASLAFKGGQTCHIHDEASDIEIDLILLSGSGTYHEDEDHLDMTFKWSIRGTVGDVAVEGTATQKSIAEE